MIAPLTTADELHCRIQDLAAQMEQDTPNIAGGLLRIWQDLKNSPELLHVLSEVELQTLATGLSLQSQVQLLAAKPAKAATKASANKKLADLEI